MHKCLLWGTVLCLVGRHPTLVRKRVGMRHPNGRTTIFRVEECEICGEVVSRLRLGDVRTYHK